MNDTTQLLITFTDIKDIGTTIKLIELSYNVIDNKIYILYDKYDNDSIILSYNINLNNVNTESIPNNTLSCHRKKQTNTIYTINALNKLLYLEYNEYNTKKQLNWNKYKNNILIIKNKELKIINTILKDIITI
ncbi:MAG TPA: hypothetical protein PLY35_10360 [Thermotogota bacterium]|nr:hypothetical protein [Thermotogota bacterium]